jgi:hypothetical protein
MTLTARMLSMVVEAEAEAVQKTQIPLEMVVTRFSEQAVAVEAAERILKTAVRVVPGEHML